MMVKNNMMKGGMIVVVVCFFLVTIMYTRDAMRKHSAPCNQPIVDPIVHESSIVVTLCRDGYHPADVKVKKDVKVVFRTELPNPHWPASNNHPSHTLYPAFDPKQPIPPNEEWSFIFDQVGKWGFHDHLRSPYVGVIEVTK